jgi:hypothetical protein
VKICEALECKRVRAPRFPLTLFFVCMTRWSLAGDICDYYQKNNPALYKNICGGGTRKTRPTGSQSSFSESFSMNSATLSTEPSSYGLESIYTFSKSDMSKSQSNFGIVKGFKKLGAGFSTNQSNTFYNNDLIRRRYLGPLVDNFEPYEDALSKRPNLNLASAVKLLELGDFGVLKLGGALKFNRFTNTWGGGPALLMGTPWVSIGAGFTREKIAILPPRINFFTALVSLRISFLELEYNQLSSNDSFKLGPVHIFTSALRFRGLTLTAAIRQANFYGLGKVQQRHYAIQYLFGKRFSVGYLNNYIPGNHSLGLQAFL